MDQDFGRYLDYLKPDEVKAFEALCFHCWATRSNAPAALFAAPEIERRAIALSFVGEAFLASGPAIAAAYREPDGSGAEIFARTLVPLLEGPGRVPGLITAIGPDESFDIFECNIQQEHGGHLDSAFSGGHVCGLIWDSYHFVEDAFGQGSSVAFSVNHLTKVGVAFAQWLFPDTLKGVSER